MLASAGSFSAQWLTEYLGGRWNGRQGVARCPAHDDSKPSMSITTGKKQNVIVHCFVCDQKDIVAKFQDMGVWPRPNAPWSPPVLSVRSKNGHVAPADDDELVFPNITPIRTDTVTYDYRDEHGTVLYQKIRKYPKGFYQQLPDGTKTLGDVRRVLYRLPELLAAPHDALVYVCEGEKDADRLASIGLVATTNHEGSGTWLDEYSRSLLGRNVVVLQDNDAPGEKHTSAVCSALRGIAANVGSLLLRPLPDGGDVSDWLDAGGSVDMLRALALAAISAPPRFRLLTLEELEALPSPEFLATDWLVQGTLSCLYGSSGIGKSFVGLDLVFSIASGTEWLGSIPTVQGPVVYVAAEGVGGLKERARAWQARHPGADLSRVRFLTMAVNLLEVDQVKELIADIRSQFEQPILVVFDTLARSMAGGDENSTKDMNTVVSAADLVRITFDCHVLIVHHTGKHGEEERGSSALRGAVDTSIYLSKEDSSIVMLCQKQKDAVEPEKLGLKLVQVEDTSSCVLEIFDVSGEFTAHARRLLRLLADHFPLDEGASTTAWLDVSGMSKQTFYRARKVLTDNRCIAKGGKRTDPNLITTEGCKELDIEPSNTTPTVGTNWSQVGPMVPTQGHEVGWYHGPTPEEWPSSGTNQPAWAGLDDD